MPEGPGTGAQGPVARKRAEGAPTDELETFRDLCEEKGIDPARAEYALLLPPDAEYAIMVLVVDLDTLRGIARRSGKVASITAPEFERDAEGAAVAATVSVVRTDRPQPHRRTAFLHERLALDPQGRPTGRWATEPERVLGEVAEALALRSALPQVLEGIYTGEDVDEALRDVEVRRVLRRSSASGPAS